jgi:hypothetical protein
MAVAAQAPRQLTDSELLDVDTALLFFGAPVYITCFAALIIWGWWNDRKDRRQRG